MPIAIPNGGSSDEPTTDEADAYYAAISVPAGERTAQEQAIVESFEAKVDAVGATKVDSGGTGGRQAAAAIEVGQRIGQMERNRKTAIDQWAQKAASGGPYARKAHTEMHGADSAVLSWLIFLTIELRERLNDSPYQVALYDRIIGRDDGGLTVLGRIAPEVFASVISEFARDKINGTQARQILDALGSPLSDGEAVEAQALMTTIAGAPNKINRYLEIRDVLFLARLQAPGYNRPTDVKARLGV